LLHEKNRGRYQIFDRCSSPEYTENHAAMMGLVTELRRSYERVATAAPKRRRHAARGKMSARARIDR